VTGVLTGGKLRQEVGVKERCKKRGEEEVDMGGTGGTNGVGEVG